MTNPDDRNRLMIFPVAKKALLDWFRDNTSLGRDFPGADVIAVHYDFDSDEFWFKARHPEFPVREDGQVIPRLELTQVG